MMKSSMVAAVVALWLIPGLASAADKNNITLRGCVVPGDEKDTFVLTRMTEVAPADRPAIPAMSHGRRVIFWLDKDDAFKKNVGRMVEVKGEIKEIKESEIELKARPQKDGGMMVEFEGPGKDIKISNDVVGDAIGTSGRTEKTDIKALLVRVDVDDVKRLDEICLR